MTTTSSKDVQIDKIFTIVSALIPSDTLITVSEWAEQNRYLDSKASGRSGLFDFDNAPHCCNLKRNTRRSTIIFH